MSEIQKLFTEKFNSMLTAHGFKLTAGVFHRVTTGKMIQIVGLLYNPMYFTLHYINIPLCSGLKLFPDIEGTHIGELFGANEAALLCPTDETIVERGLEDLHKICRLMLIPHLEKVCNYKTFCDYVILKDKIQNILLKSIEFNGYRQLKYPGFCEASMSLGDFDYPQLAFDNLTECYGLFGSRLGDTWKNRYNDLDNLLKAHKCNNNNFIFENIKMKEESTLESYKRTFTVVS